MARDYLDIKNVDESVQNKVRQRLKFRTGNFIWRVKFNIPLDPKTVNNNNLYVMTSNDIPLPTRIRYNNETNEIEVEPSEAYSTEEEYVLHISTRVRSAGGNYLKSPVKVQFKID